MSEEKQLTVAEILARAQQDNPEAGARRRRRRSLEEGGVSVAELTGSIKKVEARPAEAKHSSIPIDAPDQEATTEPAPQAPKPAPAPTPASSTRIVTAKPVQEPKPAPAPEEEPRPAESKEAPRASEDETAVIKKVTAPAVTPEPAATAAPAASHGSVEKQESAPAAVAVPAEQGDDFDPFAEDFSADAADAAVVPADEVVVEEATVNPIVLVLLVFLGVALGVLGFLLFTWIWSHTMAVVAALLGVAAVAGVVAGVSAMRHSRDALTMTLAGLAAAVAAFGPALL